MQPLLPDLDSLQPQEVVGLIYEHGRALVDVEAEIEEETARHAKLLKRLLRRRRKLAHAILPPLFERLHAERMGIPGTKGEVVLDTRITAHIPLSWDEDVRDAGFAELDRLGGESLVSVKVIVKFKSGEYEQAADLLRHISTWNKMSGREVKIEKSVSALALAKFLRELYRLRVPMNLPIMGGNKKRECRVEWS